MFLIFVGNMKKYLLSLIIILIFSSLAFGEETLRISKIAMHGPDGASDDEVSYGQTISVKATYTAADMISADGVWSYSTEPTYKDKIIVAFYSSTTPDSDNYLGASLTSVYNYAGLSASNGEHEFTFDFDLPAYSGSGSAYSFQIAFGMWGTYSGGLGTATLYDDDYTSYIATLSGEPKVIQNTLNFYTDWFEYLKGVNDGPLPVTLSSFNVSFVNGKPTLYWTTESESNNAGWIIYRSYGTNPWESGFAQLNLSEIPGQGTTTEPTDYVFVDEYPIFENQTYWYLLESICTDGVVETYPLVQITIPLGGTDPGTPQAGPDFGLKQNFPNPFNPDTEINFILNEDSPVELIIYNQKGKKIKTIYEGIVEADMVQSAYWDGKDENGKTVATGVYLYRLRTNSTNYTKRMLLMK